MRFLQNMFLSLLILTVVGAILTLFLIHLDFKLDWRTASRVSAHFAPTPQAYQDAIVQVYAARTYSWRGLFAVHTWLAIKEKHANSYKVYQVIGWLKYFGRSPLSIQQDIPDRLWFGQKPQLLRDLRGIAAEKVIVKIKQLAQQYPYDNRYTLWPGPNSNSFIAYLARNISEFYFVMPPMAIGKDYLIGNKFRDKFFARVPSGTGYQVSFYGLLGILLAKEEGIEINIFGLVFGINPKKLAIILPCIGYVGL